MSFEKYDWNFPLTAWHKWTFYDSSRFFTWKVFTRQKFVIKKSNANNKKKISFFSMFIALRFIFKCFQCLCFKWNYCLNWTRYKKRFWKIIFHGLAATMKHRNFIRTPSNLMQWYFLRNKKGNFMLSAQCFFPMSMKMFHQKTKLFSFWDSPYFDEGKLHLTNQQEKKINNDQHKFLSTPQHVNFFISFKLKFILTEIKMNFQKSLKKNQRKFWHDSGFSVVHVNILTKIFEKAKIEFKR